MNNQNIFHETNYTQNVVHPALENETSPELNESFEQPISQNIFTRFWTWLVNLFRRRDE